MPGACDGVRVLEFSRGIAGSLATMILADNGADVVRVESSGIDSGSTGPAYLLLNRGKKSISLDTNSENGVAAALRLVRRFDVLIESLGPGRADRLGIGYEVVSRLNSALVYCSVTGFGSSGPLAQVKPDDSLVMAKAGIFRDQPGWQEPGRPVFRAGNEPSYFAAMLAVQGILAALRARDLTGRGQHIETSLLKALTCRLNPKVRWLLRDGEELPPDRNDKAVSVQEGPSALAHHRNPREVSLRGMLAQCKDGRWIIHSSAQAHFFPAWISVIGFDWIWKDERFKGAPNRFADPEAERDLVKLIEARMKEKTAAEWMDLYLANDDVCADIVQTTQDALRHPQSIEAGDVVEFVDPRAGPMLQIGPLAKIPGAPPSVRAAAPVPGQHTAEVLNAPDTSSGTRQSSIQVPHLGGPLDGITIVEAAYYYAMPFASALLAELGARVIKIEPLTGDPYRALAAGNRTGDPVRNLGHNNMVRAMQGKESIALNLKDPRAQEIVHQLVARADVFVHSFRPGVPESLGIDQDTLRKINPGLLYHFCAAYGSTGPYARRPAIDPVISAFSGYTAYQAGEGNPPLSEIGADPIAAAGHATAMMLGIFARHRTKLGQYVESAMIVSNVYANCEDALSYSGKPPRPQVDHRQLGIAATHRLYRTKPPSPLADPAAEWVFLTAHEDPEFVRLCDVIGRTDIVADPRFVTAKERERNRIELDALLEPIFLTRPAADWEETLLSRGVGCVRADLMSHFNFLYRDPQARALKMMVETNHPTFGGRYWRHAPLLEFSETPAQAGPFFETGEHTRAILTELGYDDAVVAGLKDAGVITWPVDAAETRALARTN